MKLYEEVDMIENAINDILYGEEDIDIVALDNLLQAKTQTITNGLEALCKIRARKESDIAALKAESTRMKEKADREGKALTRLESYMMDMLLRSGQTKLTTGTFTVSTRASTSVYVAPDFNNPEYMRTTTTSVPDKIKIKDALQSGISIAGAGLQVKKNLAVK